jgi:ankyrin repeat protein
MNIKIIAGLLAFITIDCAGMHRPLRPQKVITSTRGMKKQTATEKLQEFINQDWKQRELGPKKSLQLIEFYIDHGANPNIKDSIGHSLLHLAIIKMQHTKIPVELQKNIIKKLLDSGADVNAVGPAGKSVLVSAAIANLPYVVEMLLEYGADPNLKSQHGWDAFSIARWPQRTEVKKVLDSHTKSQKLP